MRKKLKVEEFPAAGAALLAFEASLKKIEQPNHHIVYVRPNLYYIITLLN